MLTNKTRYAGDGPKSGFSHTLRSHHCSGRFGRKMIPSRDDAEPTNFPKPSVPSAPVRQSWAFLPALVVSCVKKENVTKHPGAESDMNGFIDAQLGAKYCSHMDHRPFNHQVEVL